MIDLSVIDAVHRALKYNDLEPLIRLMESGSKVFLEDKTARKILAKKLRGESLRGKGRPKKIDSVEGEKRNNEIISFIYFLKGFGLPVTSKRKNGDPDAETIAGERYHLDPEHIRKHIWQKRRRKATWKMSEELGRHLKSEGYKLEDLLPTD